MTDDIEVIPENTAWAIRTVSVGVLIVLTYLEVFDLKWFVMILYGMVFSLFLSKYLEVRKDA